MTTVYKAYDLHFRKNVVALKEMLQEFSSEETRNLVKRKFEDEANILVNLKHQSIPRVVDHFMERDIYYIVMEYIEGVSLDKLLEEYMGLTGKPVRQDLVAHYAIQICGILQYLHSMEPHPIIHRDIKPGNIILRKLRQEVILVDFGLARPIDPDSLGEKTLVGTVGYAPMEQFKGHPEPRSDIYALEATMNHLVSGARPTPFSLEPVEKVFAGIHPELAKIINKATAEAAADRYPSAGHMRGALLAISSLLDDRTAPPVQPAPVESAGRDESAIFTERMSPHQTMVAAEQTRVAAEGTGIAPESIKAAPVADAPEEGTKLYDTRKMPGKKEPFWNTTPFRLALVALVSAVMIIGLASFMGKQKSRRFYTLFKYPDTASTIWTCAFKGTFDIQNQGEHQSIVLGPGPEKDVRGLIFSRMREAAARKMHSMHGNIRLKGRPDMIVFLGPAGAYFRDSRDEEGNYIVELVRVSRPDLQARNPFAMLQRPAMDGLNAKKAVPKPVLEHVFSFNLVIIDLENGKSDVRFSLNDVQCELSAGTDLIATCDYAGFGLLQDVSPSDRLTIGGVVVE